MYTYPPWFKISEKCCNYAKKMTAKHDLKWREKPLLRCIGMRRSEGGVRSTRYKNCFDPENDEGIADFRPLFFLTDADKEIYERALGIEHSRCYTEYGLRRTGCAGCPFGSGFEDELKVIEQYEPKLYKAVNNIFSDSYKYTRMYREFKKQLKAEHFKSGDTNAE